MSSNPIAARLRARPSPGDRFAGAAPTGGLPLGLASRRDGQIFSPPGYRPDRPAPLAVLLHGAGGEPAHGIALLRPLAEAAGILLLAPASRRQTWDVIAGHAYGPDVTFLDQALERIFAGYAVDPARIAIGGFSDGASYALSLGLANGDLFTHVIAFSPGFMAPPVAQGAPRVFISHGAREQVLPIAACSRRIVPQLERAGYDVRYREFDGPHTVPPKIAREAVDWFMEKRV